MMRKFLILISLFFLFQNGSFAQDTLPKIKVLLVGKKAVVSWYNPYINATNINIQRSGDSLRNFTTIGSVLNVGPGENGFIDPKEFIPSNQFYRLFISFEGGTYLFTNSYRPEKDTVREIPKLADLIMPKPIVRPEKVKEEKRPRERNIFVPSQHVYTGKENNVIISLPDAAAKKYSLKFYEKDGTFLFSIKHIKQKYLTLDKVNFLHSGLFIFELYDDRMIIERHMFYIPKDGKSIPAMDRDGNVIEPK